MNAIDKAAARIARGDTTPAHPDSGLPAARPVDALGKAAALLAAPGVHTSTLARELGIAPATLAKYRASGYKSLDAAPYSLVLALAAIYDRRFPVDLAAFAGEVAKLTATLPPAVVRWLTGDPARMSSLAAYTGRIGRPRARRV